MKFCARQTSKNGTNDQMMRVFQFVTERAAKVGEDAEKQKQIDDNLRTMVRQILETSTEHAPQLVNQLLESQSFIESDFVYLNID